MNHVPISLLKPHPKNREFFPEKLPDDIWQELVDDVRKNGVINPLIVTPDYVVLAGHLRLEAAKEAGLETVPVIIKNISPDSAEAVEFLIKDNLLRRQLNDMQVARLIKKLKELYNIKPGRKPLAAEDTEKIPVEILTDFLGLPERTIRHIEKLNNLIPELQELLETGKWNATTIATIIGSLPQDEQKELLSILGEKGIISLSVAEAKEIKKELEKLRAEKDALVAKIAALESEAEEAKILRRKLQEMSTERVVEKVVYKTDPVIENQLNEAYDKIAALRQEKAEIEARLSQFVDERLKEREAWDEKVKKLEDEIEYYQDQIASLRQQMVEEKNKQKALADSDGYGEFRSLLLVCVEAMNKVDVALRKIQRNHKDKIETMAREEFELLFPDTELAKMFAQDVILWEGFVYNLAFLGEKFRKLLGFINEKEKEKKKKKFQVIDNTASNQNQE